MSNASFSLKSFKCYSVALGTVTLAILADYWIQTLIGKTLFFIPLTAVAVNSIISGYGPGIFSVFISTFALDYFLLNPNQSLPVRAFGFSLRIILFLPAGLLVAWLGGRLRETTRRLQVVLKELDEERQYRERLIVGFAHDLRNPITAAKLTIGLVKRQTESKQSVQLQHAKAALDRADELVQDFLDVSQAEAGKKVQLRRENCDVVAELREIVRDYELTGSGSVRLINSVESLPAVLDKRAIRRITENLINNALKYGNPKSVNVSLEVLDSEMFSISVHNWGPVLGPDTKTKLFHFFERHTRDSHQRGWGLGLAVVKELVEAQNGSIEVKSSEAGGTAFIVRLPA